MTVPLVGRLERCFYQPSIRPARPCKMRGVPQLEIAGVAPSGMGKMPMPRCWCPLASQEASFRRGATSRFPIRKLGLNELCGVPFPRNL